MEKNTYCVTVGEEKRSYEEGTSYQVIARDFQKDYPHDIVLAFVDGRLQELHKTLQADCTMQFETTGGSAGHKTYKRSRGAVGLRFGSVSVRRRKEFHMLLLYVQGQRRTSSFTYKACSQRRLGCYRYQDKCTLCSN